MRWWLLGGPAPVTAVVPDRLGDIPTWIAAFGAILTVAAASAAVVFAGLVWGIERRRDERAEISLRRRQAEQVDAWEHSNGDRSFTYYVMLSNTSALPVRKVCINWYAPRTLQFRAGIELPLVKPGQELITRPSEAWREDPDGLATEPHDGIPFTVDFTDSAGVRWRRGIDGRLSEL